MNDHMTAQLDREEAVASFERHRPLLFSIAYKMLGSVVEAEDIVQDAYLRYAAAGEVTSPKSFLSTVVTRLCLDRIKSAQATRERYYGTWLPEPLVTDGLPAAESPERGVEDVESISMAFLHLLQRLSPLERAVFLLHKVFDYDYKEIATIVGRSEAACRQLFHRAQEHVSAGRPRYTPTRAEAERLIGGFLTASRAGDMSALRRILAEDVVVYSDGGGKRQAARLPIYGVDKVTRFLAAISTKFLAADPVVDVREINGSPGVILWLDGEPAYVSALVLRDPDHIAELYVVANPDKLTHVPPLPEPPSRG